MKNLLKTTAVLALSTLIVTPAIADENPHRVGLDLGTGSAKYKGSSDDNDGVATSYLYYNYSFNPLLSAEIGFTGITELDKWECEGDDDSFSCQTNNTPVFDINADTLEATSIVAAVRGDWPLTKRNNLYGKVGIQQYEYEFLLNKDVIEDDKGTGVLAEAGWRYQWDFGLAIQAGFKHSRMGDLKTNTTHLGLSYAF